MRILAVFAAGAAILALAAAMGAALSAPSNAIGGYVSDRLNNPPLVIGGALGNVFAAQWLGITQIGETIKPDPERFKEFDPALRDAMLDEAACFFHRIVSEDRSVLELIQSDYTYANARLAALAKP